MALDPLLNLADEIEAILGQGQKGPAADHQLMSTKRSFCPDRDHRRLIQTVPLGANEFKVDIVRAP